MYANYWNDIMCMHNNIIHNCYPEILGRPAAYDCVTNKWLMETLIIIFLLAIIEKAKLCPLLGRSVPCFKGSL